MDHRGNRFDPTRSLTLLDPNPGVSLAAEEARSLVKGLVISHGTRNCGASCWRGCEQYVADVPDIVQEVYLRMLRVPHIESIRSPEAYLFTVAQHVVQQHTLRQSATAPSVELSRMLESPAAKHDVDPALELDALQCLERLQTALEQMPPKMRATFLLHRRDGLSFEQISAQLGISRLHGQKALNEKLDLHYASTWRQRNTNISMEHSRQSKFSKQIYEEATEWFIDCRAGDLNDAARRGLDRWLRRTARALERLPGNRRHFQRGTPTRSTSPIRRAARLIAEARKVDGNIVALPSVLSQPSVQNQDRSLPMAMPAAPPAPAAHAVPVSHAVPAARTVPAASSDSCRRRTQRAAPHSVPACARYASPSRSPPPCARARRLRRRVGIGGPGAGRDSRARHLLGHDLRHRHRRTALPGTERWLYGGPKLPFQDPRPSYSSGTAATWTDLVEGQALFHVASDAHRPCHRSKW